MMLPFEDDQGILFRSAYEVASLTPETHGRWRAVLGDGTVAFLVTPPPPGPWVPLGLSLVLPQLLSKLGDGGWQDPAGFRYPAQALPTVPSPPQEPHLAELACRPEDVIGLTSVDQDNCRWSTAQGAVDWAISATQAASCHPHLVLVREGLYINRTRLRRLTPSGGLYLDDGSLYIDLDPTTGRKFARRLGLTDLEHLTPYTPGLFNYRLRDYPLELATASAEQLKAWFDSPRQLIANLIYQAIRYRQLGIQREYGTTHRGFWYLPIYATLYRAGFAEPEDSRWVELEDESRTYGGKNSLLYQRVLDGLIGENQLFTFHELGFEDPKNYFLGDRRPQYILLVEKESLLGYARQLADTFGMTYLVSGGTSKLIVSEFLAEALQRLVTGSVTVVSYGDYDPEGWAVAEGFAAQLQRYGIQVAAQVRFLVRAECFTQQEIDLYAMPCPAGSPASLTLAKKWVEKSGGIRGQAWGIHANHLQPVERVLKRMEELL